MDKFLDYIKIVRPTYVSSPPRIWNVVYNRFKETLEERRRSPKFDGDEVALRTRVLQEFSTNIFGDRVQGVSTGGAPTSAEVMKFIREYVKICIF
jgi:long-subunit acyl-CoA synthetase (AMP-forming)